MRTVLLAIVCTFFSAAGTKAQTTLVAGELLFTSYNGIPSAGTAPDTFSFVLLKPISAGTIIYITERGYQGGPWQASGTTEGTISWTSGSALALGKEVTIAGIGAAAATVDGSPNGTVAIVLGGNVITGLSLSNAGDQLLAFQGGAGDPTSGAAVFIAGICWALSCGTTSDATWNGAGCTYGPQTSLLPAGLSAGFSALLMGNAGATPNNSHGRFNCAGTPDITATAIRTAVMNKANWLFSTSVVTTFDIPAGCLYFGSGLPLQLVSFTVRKQNESHYLQWSTASELNTSRFEIEKSDNGRLFTQLAVLNGAGKGDHTYTFRNADISNALVYYRLKMVDADGRFDYSPIIKINHYSTNDLVSVYPTPAKDRITVAVPAALQHTVALLTDAKGVPVQRIRLSNLQNHISVSTLAAGMYFLQFANGHVLKMVKE